MTVFYKAPRATHVALFLLLALCICLPARAESKKKRLWKASVAVLSAVTIADIHSSYGRRELNPFLQSHNGTFTGRGISIKAAIVGATVGTQWLMLRKRPEAAGWAAGANFAIAAATGTAVVHNHMLK